MTILANAYAGEMSGTRTIQRQRARKPCACILNGSLKCDASGLCAGQGSKQSQFIEIGQTLKAEENDVVWARSSSKLWDVP